MSEAASPDAPAAIKLAPVQKNPLRRTALVVVLIAFAMGSLFVYSYIDALGHPVARRITTAVVGTAPVRGPFVSALENTANKGLKLHSYPTLAAWGTENLRVSA